MSICILSWLTRTYVNQNLYSFYLQMAATFSFATLQYHLHSSFQFIFYLPFIVLRRHAIDDTCMDALSSYLLFLKGKFYLQNSSFNDEIKSHSNLIRVTITAVVIAIFRLNHLSTNLLFLNSNSTLNNMAVFQTFLFDQ